jgi:hypothetical protein
LCSGGFVPRIDRAEIYAFESGATSERLLEQACAGVHRSLDGAGLVM